MRFFAIGLLAVSALTVGCDGILGVQELTYSAEDGASDAAQAEAGPAAPDDGSTGPDVTTPDDATVVPGDDGGADAGEDAGDALSPDASEADADAACVNGCKAPAAQCVDGGLETCEVRASGCTEWAPPVPCGSHQTCTEGADAGVASCTCNATICAEDGTVCETAQTEATCATDTVGCHYVQGTTTCTAPQSCSGAAPSAQCALTCTDSCQAGNLACVAGGLATCTRGSNGCLAYGPAVACPSAHQTCTGAAGSATCACATDPVCQGAANYCASATSLVTCTQDAQSCRYPSSTQTCTNGACTGAAGSATCCTNACAAGTKQCATGGIQTCTVQANGCTAWSAAAACPSTRETCTGAAGAAACTCNVDPTCQGAATYCTSTTTLVTCAQDTQACRYPSATQTCDPHATCAPGASAACVCNTGYSGTGLTCAPTVAPTVSASPPSFASGAQAINTLGASQVFAVKNGGSVPTGALTAAITGTNATEFVKTADTCTGQAVAAGGTCSVTVRFDPLTFGSKVASLGITGAGTATAALTGTGTDTVLLTVAKAGTGTGTVTGGTINCGATCTESVARTTSVPTVTLSAVPSANSTFTGWTGGGCSGTGTCVVTMSAAETVTASFALIQYTLTLNTAFFGPAGATVSSSPAGISTTKAGPVTGSFTAGQVVTLTVANPTTLWSWGGACKGTAATCSVTMSSAQTVSLNVTANNYVFVTSTTTTGNFGGQAGADAICQARATAGGLPGKYQAWVSTSTSNAGTRLAATGANGWVRVDGLPFTSSLADLTTSGRVYYPPTLTELNTAYTSVAFTGTAANGTALSGETCADWTTTAGVGSGGFASGGSGYWTFAEGYGCSAAFALYCFGTDLNRPVTVTAATGRRAFLTKGAFNTGSGLAGADALCHAEATSAGLATPAGFLAFLPTSSASASSRFSLTGANWNRIDGIPIASSPANLVAGNLLSALSVHADGSYAGSGVFVISGATSPTTAGTAALTCSNWTVNTSAGGPPEYGLPESANFEFFGFSSNAGIPCATASQPIYCFDP